MCRLTTGDALHHKVKRSTPQPLDPEGFPRRLAGSAVGNGRTAPRGSWGIEIVNSLCSRRYARSATVDYHNQIPSCPIKKTPFGAFVKSS